MKKINLIIALCLATTLSFSQNDDADVGIIGGYQIPTYHEDNLSFETESGWFIGAYTSIYITEHTDVQGEINFAHFNDWYGLQMPLFYKYYPFSNFPLNFQAGVQLDWYSSDKIEVMDDKWNFFWGVGVGVDLGDHFLLQARYINEMFYQDWKLTYVNAGIAYSW